MSNTEAFDTADSRMVERNTVKKETVNTETAFLTDSSDSRLLNNETSFLLRMTDVQVFIKTKNVTVLIPPAVPTGLPPINIKRRQIIDDGLVRASWGINANPAVLVVTDWKKEACILLNRFMFPIV